MKKVFLTLIRTIMPGSVLSFLFPSKFNKIKTISYNRFITVKDELANKPFELYLREDSFMEAVILSKGIYGEWEKESLKIWSVLSKQANTILDIGANTGIYSMLAQNNNAAAKVIAVEPVDINFRVLSQNIRQNKFPVIAEKVALSDSEGTAKMYMLKERLNYMTSVNDDRYATSPHIKGDHEVVEIEVEIKPFSYLYDKYNLEKIDLVKIDVEGHELTVLNSMLPYLEKHKPTILIEIIGDENAETLNAMFNKMGYEFISINEVDQSVVVDKLWDNNHHNFLVTNRQVINFLKEKQLVK